MSTHLRNIMVLADDIEASIAFYRDVVGLVVTMDVGGGQIRWVTLAATDNPGETGQIVITSPHAGQSQEVGDQLARLLAAGNLPHIIFVTDDLDAVFARAAAHGAEILQDPQDQGWGVRDGALRDPAGLAVRVQQA